MLPFSRWGYLVVAIVAAIVLAVAVACQSAPAAPQVTERVVTQVVEKVVEKVVQQTVVVEKLVEKPVLITPTPAPTQAGADMAADQTIHYVTRGFSRLDPASEGGFGRFIISHLWMPLFLRDNKNNLQPWLATGYQANADGTVYTVSINPKAVWSDGSPVTAQEAKDYWTYGLDPDQCKGCYLGAFGGMELVKGAKDVIAGKSKDLTGVVVKDQKTLEFQLTGPDPIFINRLALFDTGFAKMEDVKKGPNFASDGSARVNGPFMVKIWDLDKKQYEIVQNPKWWGDKKPAITRIVAQEAADENVSFIQWQNNEVDVALWLSNIRERIRKDQANTFFNIPYATNLYFPLWLSQAPMDDLNVRKALVHAVDWDKAIAAAWEGARNDRVMKTILTPELQCYKKDNWPGWGYDPAKAKQELAASKYGSPDKLGKIRITTGGQSPNYIRTAEIMAEQWKTNLGITDVEIKPGTLDAWGQDAQSVQVRRQSQGAILPDALSLIGSHYNTYTDATSGSGLKDDELGKMIDTLRSMKRDDPKFCEQIQQAEAKLLGNYYLLPMIWDVYEYNAKPWVKNFNANVDNNWYTLLDIYLAKH
ncbi:MAG: ABC transporter substrate-binding protein [Anaerolineae bacterium]|nr:ABC transporter substrate-binding protein [Anaerolineae bacterium]